jgi:TyrR family helix-turn-helix protein
MDIYKYLNEDKMKKILNCAYDEIFVYDDDYNVIFANAACERHYGLSQDQIIGKTFFQLIDRECWYPSVLPSVYAEKKPLTIEQTSILGEKLITTAVPVLDENGEIELVVMSVYDSNTDLINQRLQLEKNELDMKRDFCSETNGGVKYFSESMVKLMKYADKIVDVDSTVLISGESGTGKSLLANYIHCNGSRKDAPFVSINCAAIPEDLLESELFGYEKGAFTGANNKGKKGLLELADGGVLFLDEIGELSFKLQAKILHVIQERKFMSVGGRKNIEVDIRIIAATNKDLFQLVKDGDFREDLYWRLNVIELKIPPLRDRIDDIIGLLEHFSKKLNKKLSLNKSFSSEAYEAMISYDWPGNVRQLENFIERSFIISDKDQVQKHELPKNILGSSEEVSPVISEKENLDEQFLSYDDAMNNYERSLVSAMYEKYPSTRKLAKAMGITQSKAARLIKKHI